MVKTQIKNLLLVLSLFLFATQIIVGQSSKEIGKKAIDFTITTNEHEEVTLSSYKGKYLLLQFWSSQCIKCRTENPSLLGIYNQYKEFGFEILSISLDKEDTKQEWLTAIKKDRLIWRQGSELKGWAGKVSRMYGVTSTPANFLIDPKGKIIFKDLLAEELKNRLKQIFQ
jgi:peroxiredoxin